MDWKIRSGYLSEQMPLAFPAGVGMGRLRVSSTRSARVWDGVTVGDRVFGAGTGALAEHAVLSAWPCGGALVRGGGYPIPVETAIRILDKVGVPLARCCW